MCGCLSHAPYWGPGPQPCALTGNQSSKLSVRRPAFTPLSHTSQGFQQRFKWKI